MTTLGDKDSPPQKRRPSVAAAVARSDDTGFPLSRGKETAQRDDASAAFEAVRPRLRALAYRMLGSIEDADDAVQETFVRWHTASRGEIESPAAWLTATCTRLSIDMLRSAYRRRESYVGPWLPEPVVEAAGHQAPDPAELSDSLSTAFLLLMERLSPLERAAFLLYDVFGYSYAEIAQILGRNEAACRQLASRARRQVRSERPRFASSRDHATMLLERFLAAAREGDVDGLVGMLSADAELWSDGGGETTAARNVLRSADHVARFIAGVSRKGGDALLHRAIVNGAAGIVLIRDDRVIGTFTVDLDDEGKISRVFVVLAPSKLARVSLAVGTGH